MGLNKKIAIILCIAVMTISVCFVACTGSRNDDESTTTSSTEASQQQSSTQADDSQGQSVIYDGEGYGVEQEDEKPFGQQSTTKGSGSSVSTTKKQSGNNNEQTTESTTQKVTTTLPRAPYQEGEWGTPIEN